MLHLLRSKEEIMGNQRQHIGWSDPPAMKAGSYSLVSEHTVDQKRYHNIRKMVIMFGIMTHEVMKSGRQPMQKQKKTFNHST